MTDGITDQPCNQALAPISNVPEGQNGKRNLNDDGRYAGIGGGFNARMMFKNKPPNDHKVNAVNQEISERGLRVTIYNPSHRAVMSARKFTV